MALATAFFVTILAPLLAPSGSVSLPINFGPTARRWAGRAAGVVAPAAAEGNGGSAAAHEEQFDAFILKHGRGLAKHSDANERRFALFRRRVMEAEEHNAQPGRRWSATVNHLSDRTEEELHRLCGWRGTAAAAASSRNAGDGKSKFRSMLSQRPIRGSRDWLQYEHMQFIRDQGECGSCWAVAASTVLGVHAEINGINRTFSTQELVDCVPNPDHCGGGGGCDGATVELAMQYALERGLSEPSAYGAYSARDGKCSTDVDDKFVQLLTSFSRDEGTFSASTASAGPRYGMKAWEKLPSNKYRPLLQALYHHGPVAVSLAASDLFNYGSGIFDGCRDFVVNHAVTLAGFGEDGTDKYWLVQNSWGEHWGEEGRIRILRRDDEESHCGEDDQPQDGVACEGETQPVNVCGTCGILYDSVLPHFAPLSV